MDDFGFPFYSTALAELFQTKKTFAIELGSDEEDIPGIQNVTRTPVANLDLSDCSN